MYSEIITSEHKIILLLKKHCQSQKKSTLENKVIYLALKLRQSEQVQFVEFEFEEMRLLHWWEDYIGAGGECHGVAQ